jgi:hypothetical protein
MEVRPNPPRRQPTAVLACAVLRDLLGPRLSGVPVSAVYMDYGLHVRPKRMAPALQAELDALATPHTVLIGYGLCGGGLAGLRAGPHTLVIPRTDDCIAILLGSRQAYLDAQKARPGTYYLTRGWLECGAHPLAQHRELVERFGLESADHVVDAMYAHYTALCFVASTPEEIPALGPRVREVAEFCAERWGMEYSERVGSSELVDSLLGAPRGARAADLVVVPPGGTVEQFMFARG